MFHRWFVMTTLSVLGAAGCDDGAAPPTQPGSVDPIDDGAMSDEEVAASLGLGPVAEGYTRYVAPPIEVASGESHDWMQWIGGPLDQDYDVIDVMGAQGVGGHHALVYATSVVQEAGFTRLFNEEDQLKMRLLGGVGGEGGANVKLPPGAVFRVKKGSYLVAQTHFLNYTTEPIIGRSVVDVKLAPVNPENRVASMFGSADIDFSLPPGEDASVDLYCTTEEDLAFLSFANHMHEHGKRVHTEVTEPSGATYDLKRDDRWSPEWALNPNFMEYTLESPRVIPAGSRIHTHCEWRNEGATPVTFPAEMCVFFGFVLSENDVSCVRGMWSEASLDASVEGAREGAPPDSCLSGDDRTTVEAAGFSDTVQACVLRCGLGDGLVGCAAACLEEDARISGDCATCYAASAACGIEHCLGACAANKESPDCVACTDAHCIAEFTECRGY